METEELLSTIRSAYTHASEHAVIKNTRNTQGVFDDVENFLTGNYELRYNVVSTRMEIREKDSKDNSDDALDKAANKIVDKVSKKVQDKVDKKLSEKLNQAADSTDGIIDKICKILGL
jgi:predicted P-loop ATPase/GTPase